MQQANSVVRTRHRVPLHERRRIQLVVVLAGLRLVAKEVNFLVGVGVDVSQAESLVPVGQNKKTVLLSQIASAHQPSGNTSKLI